MAGNSSEPLARAIVPHGWTVIGQIPFGARTQLALQGIGLLLLGALVALSEAAWPARGLVRIYLTTRHAAWIFLAGMALTIILHEGLHGLALAGHGFRPKFGVGRSGFLPFAWCSANAICPRRAFWACSLAPLLILDGLAATALAMGAPAALAYAVLVANTLGAVADVWGVLYLARFPADSAVLETLAANAIVRRIG